MAQNDTTSAGAARDVDAELLAAGWERDDRAGHSRFVLWTLPDIASRVTTDRARKILDGAVCPAVLFHGPGHQSKAECELVGPHDVHETHYGDGQHAFWRTGAYTDQIDAKGAGRNVRSYPKTMGMTGYFDEPPVAAEPPTAAAAERDLRDRAVAIVDARHGMTAEFAPDPDSHRAEYDQVERRLHEGDRR